MLTKQEILSITETIDKAEISFSHLRDDLIDHVCCEIEYQVEKGISFKQAFETIKGKIGIHDLQKVQENTLLLIDKNYRIMKTLMKISGVLSLIGLTIGTLARIYRTPGANYILSLGFLLLCFVFLPSAVYIMRKENKANTKIMLYLSAFIGSIGFCLGIFFKIMHWPGTAPVLLTGIIFISLVFFPLLWVTIRKSLQSKTQKVSVLIGIIAGSIFFIASLFKINHWAGANILYLVSVLSLVLIFIPLYSYSSFKNYGYVSAKFIYIIFAFTFSILLSMLLQMHSSYEAILVFKKDTATCLNSITYLQAKNAKTELHVSDTLVYNEINLMRKKLQETDEIIEKVKIKFTGIDPDLQIDKESILTTVNLPTNSEIFEYLLFEGNENSVAYCIEKNMSEVRDLISNTSFGNKEVISALLDTKVPDEISKNGIKWEDYIFRKKSPLTQFEILLWLQKRINLAEQELINDLQNK